MVGGEKDFNGMKIVRIAAKRAFQPTNIPGADYVLNPYAGCAHGCIYCYAKFMGRFMAGHFVEQGESLPGWGKWVAIKENFPELVEKESREIAERGKTVYMASVSDAYQPIEGREKIVRKSLQAMDRRTKLSILTKSSMVLRDADILSEFGNAEVGFSLNALGEKERREIEPMASPIRSRVMAMEKLAQKGIPVYAFISPIIPGYDVLGLVDSLSGTARHFWFEFLNKRPGKPLLEWMRKNKPEAYRIASNPAEWSKWVASETQKIAAYARRAGISVRGIVSHGNTGMDVKWHKH